MDEHIEKSECPQMSLLNGCVLSEDKALWCRAARHYGKRSNGSCTLIEWVISVLNYTAEKELSGD